MKWQAIQHIKSAIHVIVIRLFFIQETKFLFHLYFVLHVLVPWYMLDLYTLHVPVLLPIWVFKDILMCVLCIWICVEIEAEIDVDLFPVLFRGIQIVLTKYLNQVYTRFCLEFSADRCLRFGSANCENGIPYGQVIGYSIWEEYTPCWRCTLSN